jgi:hypothetical protein
MPMEAQRDTEQKYTYLVRQRNRLTGLAASDPAVRGKKFVPYRFLERTRVDFQRKFSH